MIRPPRRMNMGMQGFNIGRMFANTRWNTEMIDIKANLDRTLNYGENVRNMQRQYGVQTRNRGMERIEQERDERNRERERRRDTTRQTGRYQNPHNIEIDRMFEAMRPGKRFSRTGHRRYYERRSNRSDRNPSERL